MTSLIITSIKNNNDILDEWVRYHLAIGFSHILIYDNNSNLDDWPMSDYIISQCSNGYVTIIDKRNKQINVFNEFNKIYNKFDFYVIVNINEYISNKTQINNINELLKNENSSFFVNVYPFDIKDNNEILNLKEYIKNNSRIFKKQNDDNEPILLKSLFIKKILSVE